MSKSKGYHHEVEITKKLNEAGISTRRVPMSGALKRAGPDLDGDLKIFERWTAEVKYRANGKGFVQLEKWMQECQILIVKRARQKPMVMMDWDTFIELMGEGNE